MSQAPKIRKSLKALPVVKATAAAVVEKSKPRPHQVIIRVKRKRGDAAVDSLFVVAKEDDEPDRKRRLAAESIAENLAGLNLEKNRDDGAIQKKFIQAPARLCYKRSRPTDLDSSFPENQRSRGTNSPPEEIKAVETLGTSSGGSHLDASLRKKSKAIMASEPSVVDYLEERMLVGSSNAKRFSNTMYLGEAAQLDAEKARPRIHHPQYLHPVQRLRARAKTVGATVSNVNRESEHSKSSSSRMASPAAEFHVIDLQPVAISKSDPVLSGLDGEIGQATSEGSIESLAAAPVLNPYERQLDEAIFTAFRTGDLSTVWGTLSSSPALVNYRRRIGDGTTALMAAAFVGDMDYVRHFLSLGAKASLVDFSGKTAAVLAGMRGHRECFAELQRVADQEVRGSQDFVYDLYYFSPTESKVNSQERGSGPIDQTETHESSPLDRIGDETVASRTYPVVHLSGIGPIDENAADTMGLEITFERDCDWSELGNDDLGDEPDSNSEGYYANDYPEEEDEDDGSRPPYLYEDSPGAWETGSFSDGMSSSDEEPYCRRMVNSFELNRCTDRSNLVNSSGLETGDLQQQLLASADSDTMDCLPFPVMERAQVFAWERES